MAPAECWKRTAIAATFSALLTGGASGARADEEVPEKIRDNLFLLEEAYNQEPGVIQHIQSFQYIPENTSWAYSFTEEWPILSERHQISVAIPAQRPDEGTEAGLGDILLNYRIQARGRGGRGALAVAPRISLVLPTGHSDTAHGRGGVGIQINIPASIELSASFVAHTNAGLTLTPGAESPGGREGSALDLNTGAALVWLPRGWFNLLAELAHQSVEEIRDTGSSARASTVIVNPGTRFAIDFDSGLQIVPGISVPLTVHPSAGGTGVLIYLSFEHPL